MQRIPINMSSVNGHPVGIGHVPGRKQMALISNNSVIAYVPKGRERQAIVFFEKITGQEVRRD